MSYYLYDANGYLDDGPSITGLNNLHAWAQDQDPVIAAFFEDGSTDDLPAFIAALEVTSAEGSVESSRVALLRAAKRADELLILSDGMEPQDG